MLGALLLGSEACLRFFKVSERIKNPNTDTGSVRTDSLHIRGDMQTCYWASGETVDTLALGASAARHGGSSPLSPTKLKPNVTSGDIWFFVLGGEGGLENL